MGLNTKEYITIAMIITYLTWIFFGDIIARLVRNYWYRRNR